MPLGSFAREQHRTTRKRAAIAAPLDYSFGVWPS